MRARLFLSGIQAEGRHGARPGEKDEPQPFVIDLDLEVEVGDDRIADTADYRDVCERGRPSSRRVRGGGEGRGGGRGGGGGAAVGRPRRGSDRLTIRILVSPNGRWLSCLARSRSRSADADGTRILALPAPAGDARAFAPPLAVA